MVIIKDHAVLLDTKVLWTEILRRIASSIDGYGSWSREGAAGEFTVVTVRLARVVKAHKKQN